MTLPFYPDPISASQIQTEFGGSNPVSLSEYYSNGTLVPVGTVGRPFGAAYTGIPTSGQISYSNFHGAQDTFTFFDYVNEDMNNYNVYARAVAAGWNTYSTLVTFTTVASGVKVIYMTSGIYTDKFVTWNIINSGTILGVGGSGGNGASLFNPVAGGGQRGGDAINSSAAQTVIQNYGAIYGGGGGGGGGGAVWADWRSTPSGAYSDISMTGGGGGAGATTYVGNSLTTAGAAGTVSGSYASAQYIINSANGSVPSNGSLSGGAGGANSTFGTTYYDPTNPKSIIIAAGAGGAGGGAGEDGANGGYHYFNATGATWYSIIPRDPGLGALAGIAVRATGQFWFHNGIINTVVGGINTPSNGYGLYGAGVGAPQSGWYNANLGASTSVGIFDPYILISFNSDGTITTNSYNTEFQSGMLTGNDAFWHAQGSGTLSSTPGIGTLFYIKYTGGITVPSSFSYTSGMSPNTWYRLDSSRQLQIRRVAGAAGTTNANMTFTIATERTNTVLSGSISAAVTIT